MLKGLLMDDESLNAQAEENILVYSAAEFFDIEGNKKRGLPVGQALLTSKRLLLLSCITKQSKMTLLHSFFYCDTAFKVAH